jgi:hypothetical protein
MKRISTMEISFPTPSGEAPKWYNFAPFAAAMQFFPALFDHFREMASRRKFDLAAP